MLVGILVICLVRRSFQMLRDMTLIVLFVSGHILYLCIALNMQKELMTETGILLQLFLQTMFFIMLIIQYYSLQNRRQLMLEAEELKHLRLRMESNEGYYRLAERKFTEISKLRHDIHAQIQTVSALLRDPDGRESAESIIETLKQRMENTGAKSFCENRTLNAVLSVKLDDLQDSGIRTEISLQDCGNLPFSDFDLCSLISNLFDNAADCCRCAADPAGTQIVLKSGIRSGYFVISCVNTCTEPPSDEQNSRPKEGHGYGKEIIRSICRKYDGEYTLRYADGQAAATVMLLCG